MVLAMASLGLPGLGNFVAEFLVLAGTWQTYPLVAGVAVMGLVMAAIYALRIIQGVFHGEETAAAGLPDVGLREAVVLGVVVVALLWMGLYPQPVLDLARMAFQVAGGGP
jgi:NADH-quinone oxidoreductase subunit M